MNIHVEPSSISNIMVKSNKCKERTAFDITEKINRVLMHHKFMRLFYKQKESYMICIGDTVTSDNMTITVKTEQDLKNIIKLIKTVYGNNSNTVKA